MEAVHRGGVRAPIHQAVATCPHASRDAARHVLRLSPFGSSWSVAEPNHARTAMQRHTSHARRAAYLGLQIERAGRALLGSVALFASQTGGGKSPRRWLHLIPLVRPRRPLHRRNLANSCSSTCRKCHDHCCWIRIRACFKEKLRGADRQLWAVHRISGERGMLRAILAWGAGPGWRRPVR
jgi:hypothetical protein